MFPRERFSLLNVRHSCLFQRQTRWSSYLVLQVLDNPLKDAQQLLHKYANVFGDKHKFALFLPVLYPLRLLVCVLERTFFLYLNKACLRDFYSVLDICHFQAYKLNKQHYVIFVFVLIRMLSFIVNLYVFCLYLIKEKLRILLVIELKVPYLFSKQ